MGTDHIVVLAFSLVILILFASMIVDYVSPMFLKTGFDELCRHYLLIAEASNGLSGSQRKELEESLRKMGLKDIRIRIEERDTVARRKEYVLRVECTYDMNVMKRFFVRETEAIVLKFEHGFLARRIVE